MKSNLVDIELSLSQQSVLAARKPSGMGGRWSAETHLESCIQLWAP